MEANREDNFAHENKNVSLLLLLQFANLCGMIPRTRFLIVELWKLPRGY